MALRLPPERPGRSAPADVGERRAAMAQALSSGLWRTDPPARAAEVAGVRVLRFAPGGEAGATVLHLHGGGFRLGCPEQVSGFAAALAARCGVEVVCPAYRLAPEHPFPAGLADAWAVAAALGRDGRPLIVSGDSAGGGLAAGVAALAGGQGLALAGLILLSAWLDLTVSSGSYATNAATDPLFSRASAEAAAELYLQGWPALDPLASPLFAPPAAFPPTLISIGEGEVLADDGRALHRRLQEAGVRAELHAVAGMEHVAVTRSFELTGAAETFEQVARFIEELAPAA